MKMKRKKKSGPTTVTIHAFNEKDELVTKFQVPIHYYTTIQRLAQARSISFDEMMAEALSGGAERMLAELKQKKQSWSLDEVVAEIKRRGAYDVLADLSKRDDFNDIVQRLLEANVLTLLDPRSPKKGWKPVVGEDEPRFMTIYGLLDAIANYHAPLRTLKVCQKCGWTREIIQRQLFTPDGEPRRYEPLIDPGCPRCHDRGVKGG